MRVCLLRCVSSGWARGALQKEAVCVMSAETKGRSTGSGARLTYLEFINCLLRFSCMLPTGERGASAASTLDSLVRAPDSGTAADAALHLAASVDEAFVSLMVSGSAWCAMGVKGTVSDVGVAKGGGGAVFQPWCQWTPGCHKCSSHSFMSGHHAPFPLLRKHFFLPSVWG